MRQLSLRAIRCLLVLSLIIVPAISLADEKAPYSKPYHKQGRGWYPSIYWSTGRNFGSFYLPNTEGALFEEVKDEDWADDVNGLIYFYRPYSQWASEELTAPSYYINDELIFSLRAGSYTYVELPEGSYDFAVRKSIIPLIGIEAFDDKLMIAVDFNLQADVGLEISPGTVLYFRHSELTLPSQRHPDLEADDPMSTADVQLVVKETAMPEMKKTRYLNHSFWHPTDAETVEGVLSGEIQEYGWFTVIWPWSNNFLYGFPLFYVPSDMYRELRGDVPLTIEEELYLLADDKEAYLEAIEDMRTIKRDWWAPWREPATGLSLNDVLTLDRLERDAIAGNIKPVSTEHKKPEKWGWFKKSKKDVDDGQPWYWPFGAKKKEEPAKVAVSKPMEESRRANMERIKQLLN